MSIASRPAPIGFATNAKLEGTRSGVFADPKRFAAATRPDAKDVIDRLLFDEYEIEKDEDDALGGGTYGVVYPARRKADGAPMVYKELLVDGRKKKASKYEVVLSGHVSFRMRRNPFFSRVDEVAIDASGRAFAMAEKLFPPDPIEETGDRVEALSAALCLAGALRLAWERMGFRHRDLHGGNVMLRPRPTWARWICFRFRDGSTMTVPAPSAGLPVIIDYGNAYVEEMADECINYDNIYPEDRNRDWCFNADLRRWLISTVQYVNESEVWPAILSRVEAVIEGAKEDGYGPSDRRKAYGEILVRTTGALRDDLTAEGVGELSMPGRARPDGTDTVLFVGYRPGTPSDHSAGALVDETVRRTMDAAAGTDAFGALDALRSGRVAARLLRLPVGYDAARAEDIVQSIARRCIAEGRLPEDVPVLDLYIAAAWINRAGVPGAFGLSVPYGSKPRPFRLLAVDEDRTAAPGDLVRMRAARYVVPDGEDAPAYFFGIHPGRFASGSDAAESIAWEECCEWDPEAREGRGMPPKTFVIPLGTPPAKRRIDPPSAGVRKTPRKT